MSVKSIIETSKRKKVEKVCYSEVFSISIFCLHSYVYRICPVWAHTFSTWTKVVLILGCGNRVLNQVLWTHLHRQDTHLLQSQVLLLTHMLLEYPLSLWCTVRSKSATDPWVTNLLTYYDSSQISVLFLRVLTLESLTQSVSYIVFFSPSCSVLLVSICNAWDGGQGPAKVSMS